MEGCPIDWWWGGAERPAPFLESQEKFEAAIARQFPEYPSIESREASGTRFIP